MTTVKKFTLGFRVENKVFRMESLRGTLIDTLLDARGKEISETYYTGVGENIGGGLVTLVDEKDGNLLVVDRESIVLTKSAYKTGHVDLDKTFAEFKRVWNVVQQVVKFKGIRRIGLVAEHRFDSAHNNIELLTALTKLDKREFPSKFMMHLESRLPVKSGIAIDIAKGAFINIIYDFYDSAADAQVPTDGKINANLDYQRYYAPLLV